RIEREETFELPAAARDRFLMEIPIETPRDAAVRRDLTFNPRFHDSDALVASLRSGVIDHRAVIEVARTIQNEIKTSPALENYTLALWQAIRSPAESGISIPGVETAHLVQGG